MTQLHDLLEEGRQPPISTQATGSGVRYWIFPQDYDQRIARILSGTDTAAR